MITNNETMKPLPITRLLVHESDHNIIVHESDIDAVTRAVVEKLPDGSYEVRTFIDEPGGLPLDSFRAVRAHKHGEPVQCEPDHYLQRQNNVSLAVYQTQFPDIEWVDHPGTSWTGLGSCKPHSYIRKAGTGWEA